MAEELSPREGYAAWAPLYDGDGNPLTAMEGPAIWRRLGDLRGQIVLDLGCGTGRHSVALVDAGASVVGVDLTPEMLEVARIKFQADHDIRWVVHALPEPLPFADAHFDLVIMGLVAEHIHDLAGVMAEIARVLRPGGRVMVSNLHPDRTADGQRARFIDPETGQRRPIRGYHRSLEEFRAIGGLDLTLTDEETLTVPQELAGTLPRAERYIGLPLGWIGVWVRNAPR